MSSHGSSIVLAQDTVGQLRGITDFKVDPLGVETLPPFRLHMWKETEQRLQSQNEVCERKSAFLESFDLLSHQEKLTLIVLVRHRHNITV